MPFEKVRSFIGGAITIGLAAYWFHSALTLKSAYVTLVSVRIAIAGVLLILRRPAKRGSPAWVAGFAYVSTALPYFYGRGGTALFDIAQHVGAYSVLAGWFLLIAGNLLAIWGTLSLGRSFGISPAVRERIKIGAYRLLKHPIYVGYVLSEGGFVLMMPTLHNVVLYAVSSSFYVARGRIESTLFEAAEMNSRI